ncbi:hypothetical protein GCM10018790_68570 [Kitasatospora xanthocidica]|nr:hypothetical protein GCM10018790_68570 [Kitasatospora xanthocidica]
MRGARSRAGVSVVMAMMLPWAGGRDQWITVRAPAASDPSVVRSVVRQVVRSVRVSVRSADR